MSVGRDRGNAGCGGNGLAPSTRSPVYSAPMFAARPFVLNITAALQAGAAARAITTKTTTITG